MKEFSLSSQEGVALMCLAEALLRVPDKDTADRLIRDKLAHGDWRAHIGNSPGPGVDNNHHNTDPLFFEDAIRRHPGCRFILGHVGYDFVGKTLGDIETCLRFARQYPYVFLAASALGSNGSDPPGADRGRGDRVAPARDRQVRHRGLAAGVLALALVGCAQVQPGTTPTPTGSVDSPTAGVTAGPTPTACATR